MSTRPGPREAEACRLSEQSFSWRMFDIASVLSSVRWLDSEFAGPLPNRRTVNAELLRQLVHADARCAQGSD